MLTIVKSAAVQVTLGSSKAAKLLVGDVIATKGTVDAPQRLRRVDIIDGDDYVISTPKTGADIEAVTYPKGTKVVVVGRVEDRTVATPKAKTAKPKAAPKQRATAKNPAPVKIHGETPNFAPKGTEKRTTTPKAAAAPQSSLREAIRTELRSAVQAMVLAEVKSVIAEALA